MARNKSRIIFFLFYILCALNVQAQGTINRYFVYFTDKNNSSYSVEHPEEFLSAKAIERRQKQGISINQKDIPVNQNYIDGLEETGASVYYSSRWLNGVLVEMDEGIKTDVEGKSYVLEVELAAPGSKLTTTNPSSRHQKSDSLEEVSLEYNFSTSAQLEMLGADHMHNEDYTGEGLLIAVCDGGFKNVQQLSYFDHLFSANRLVCTYDFVRNSEYVYDYSAHGTKALSCIGAYSSEQLKGVAYNASFLLFVTEDVSSEYRIEEYNWVFAAEAADSTGADVINTSLGYFDFDDSMMNYSYSDMDGNSTIITQAADIAAEKGMIIVVSAGNEGDNYWYYITAPADADSVLSVGAVDNMYSKASFSSFGPTFDERIKPDVAALGYATVVGGASESFQYSNGTSFSSPLIAGLAAITWQKYPTLSNMEVIEQIKNAGHMAQYPDNTLGYGVPNFYRDENDIVLGDGLEHVALSIYPNPVREGKLYLKGLGTNEYFQIKVYNTTGQSFEVSFEEINDQTVRLDISHLRSGVYFLQVNDGNNSQTIKVMKF